MSAQLILLNKTLSPSYMLGSVLSTEDAKMHVSKEFSLTEETGKYIGIFVPVSSH